MKYSAIFFLSVFSFFVVSHSSAQERYLSGKQIPASIVSYVKNYFPKASIRKVKVEKEILETEYEVKLSPKTELEFDGNYKITELESPSALPLKALPVKVQTYVKKNYPSLSVREWEKKCKGQKVKLQNGTKLYFYPDGKYAGKKR